MKKLKLVKGRKTLLIPIILIFFLLLIYSTYNILFNLGGTFIKDVKYISGNSEIVNLYDHNLKKVNVGYRGHKVNAYKDVIVGTSKNRYIKIKYNEEYFYISESNLTKDKHKIVLENKVYVRTPATLYKSIYDGSILSLSKKGDELEVVGYDTIDNKGKVNAYKVKSGNNVGYVYQKYVLTSKEEALKNYDPTKYYDVHNARGNRFGGGYAGNLDYYPVEKGSFKDNVMPSKVYALYLNSGHNIISNVDAFIEYAKTTKINAFVIDIKDDTSIGYASKVLERFSKTNYNNANNSFDTYKEAIKKIKDAGFYVIGRITAFKDKNYCIDNPDDAILNTQTNSPFLHNDTYWPSPYQRSVWEYNVALAKEAITEMVFNEIQFDYLSFPYAQSPST
jgi:hypothetical protein